MCKEHWGMESLIWVEKWWKELEYHSEEAQQSQYSQSSCTKLHILIHISSLNVPDFFHQDSYMIPWEIGAIPWSAPWSGSAPKYNGFFPDSYRILPPGFMFVMLLTANAQTNAPRGELICGLHQWDLTSVSSSGSQVAAHDWIKADCKSTKCLICHKKIKTLAGRRCAWCQEMVRIVHVYYICVYSNAWIT